MRLVFGQDASVAAWVASQIPHMNGGDFGPCAAIGVVDERGNIAGGLVYHNYIADTASIHMSMAAINPHFLTRNLVTALLKYPLRQLGVNRITAITPSDRTTSIWRFLSRFGFQQEGHCRDGLGIGKDAVIWSLLARDWALHRFNAERAVEVRKPRRRRRRRGTLSLQQGASVH